MVARAVPALRWLLGRDQKVSQQGPRWQQEGKRGGRPRVCARLRGAQSCLRGVDGEGKVGARRQNFGCTRN